MTVRNMADENFNCGCLAAILAFNLAPGGWSVDYCLWFIARKDAPWYADVIAGMFAAQLSVPLAVLLWVLNLAGVEAPLLN